MHVISRLLLPVCIKLRLDFLSSSPYFLINLSYLHYVSRNFVTSSLAKTAKRTTILRRDDPRVLLELFISIWSFFFHFISGFLPSAGDYDVVVVGGGPGGYVAAIKAGQLGLKVRIKKYSYCQFLPKWQRILAKPVFCCSLHPFLIPSLSRYISLFFRHSFSSFLDGLCWISWIFRWYMFKRWLYSFESFITFFPFIRTREKRF